MIDPISSGSAPGDPLDGRGGQPPIISKRLAISFRDKVFGGKQASLVWPRMNLL